MIAVLNGTVDDGWGGMLGWMWLMCSITTIILIFVTQAALKERAYSAVMAATDAVDTRPVPRCMVRAIGTSLVVCQ